MNPISSPSGKRPSLWARLALGPVRRFLRDASGVAAVEFAMLAPVLLLMYFATVQVTQGVILNRKTTLAAATVGNIVAQYTTISQSQQLPDILNASAQIFAPYSSSASSIIVSSLSVDGSGHATVAWSQGLNTSARPTGQSVTIPSGFAVPNTTVILSEASYAYSPVADYLHMGTITLYAPIFMSPRASTTITLVQ
jgi:Flp pilus assembly protein TadG